MAEALEIAEPPGLTDADHRRGITKRAAGAEIARHVRRLRREAW
jgi:hypothetical protein